MHPRPMVLLQKSGSENLGMTENEEHAALSLNVTENTDASAKFSRSRLEALRTRCEHAGTGLVARLEHLENVQLSTSQSLQRQLGDVAQVQRRLCELEALLWSR